MTAAERARKCYWTNLEYRERAKARARKWAKRNRKRLRKSQKRWRMKAKLADRWIEEWRTAA